ncbi:hypothetical protein D0Z00_004500 [Geotrichum galactomycetum]|uniref:Uncharacterized protein n=1 Tax=Geotrichum galactomycetum TaxID=27317 RepID=A0ACB6UY98_9ASCO|nr:hypothetical protein D0Z00_004500 [Geotrichum candidum]
MADNSTFDISPVLSTTSTATHALSAHQSPPPVTTTTTNIPTASNAAVANSAHLLEDPKMREILISDVGVESLVARLKQSVISAKELAGYTKKRASIEADRLADANKLGRQTKDALRRDGGRQGTLVRQFDELLDANERIMDAVSVFVTALHAMHDELSELAKKNEKSRKALKESSMRDEKNLIEAEQNAEKARSKYVSLCEEMERLKDPNKGAKFGFNKKNTPQHEQELQSKINSAESEYRQRVYTAEKQRKDLVNQIRPQNVRQLMNHIMECDSGISLQLQKYSTLNEILALNSGFIVSPLKPVGSTTAPLSMKEMAAKIDDELDFYNDVIKIPTVRKQLNRPEVRFIQHPLMSSVNSYGNSSGGGALHTTSTNTNSYAINSFSSPPTTTTNTFSSPSTTATTASTSAPVRAEPTNRNSMIIPSMSSSIAPSIAPVTAVSPVAAPAPNFSEPVNHSELSMPVYNEAPDPTPAPINEVLPSFGTDLATLMEWENPDDPTLMPRVISQCVTAIDKFGADSLGIYRTEGDPVQVQTLKQLFDTNPASVDLSQPAKYGIGDIHAVSSTLKLYFKELPDPLLTAEFREQFLNAARIDIDWKRRDAVHTVINNLVDANYIALRYLTFHLFRVAQHEATNRMGIVHLGTVWGPILVGANPDDTTEAALAARVVETILYHAEHIFESD